MNLKQLRASARAIADDTITGGGAELWSVETLDDDLNRAEREACIRGELLQEIDVDLYCKVALTDGGRSFPLHKAIIEVKKARIRDRREDLDLCAIESVWTTGHGGGYPTRCAVLGEIGETRGRKVIFDRPMPIDGFLDLFVVRFPKFAMVGELDEPEIGLEHHDALVWWALHLAFLHRDIDAEDQARAAKFEAMFTERFGIRVDANVARKQRRHKAPVVRAGAYP